MQRRSKLFLKKLTKSRWIKTVICMRHYLKSTFQSRKPYTQRRNEQKTSNAQKKLIHMTILSAFPDPQFYPPFLGQNAA